VKGDQHHHRVLQHIIALAVGLTPELLPMVVTVTLSRGAQRMAKQRVIVKQLTAIHNLGSMDGLCTDKTGTLTEARIRLERHLDALGNDSERVLKLAYLNSHFETGIKSPLDDAILAHEHIDVAGWTKVDEVPFDFERRRVSVLLDGGAGRMLAVKGAPEDILRLCTHYAADGDQEPVPLDAGVRSSIGELHDRLSSDGFRMLGVAWRKVAPDHPHAVVGDESELVFAGFAAFLDPPKESAAAALKALSASGIEVKVLTGDGELITRHIFSRLGMPVKGVLTGGEVDGLDDPALAVRIREANLLCRLNPAQKNRIILSLKAHGHTVGYLGDGINDAPALQSADVGISVEDGADVAKAAAHMILLEQNLGVLYSGVLEGRRTYANIMKYVMMGTSSNFGNMFSMAGATLFLSFLPMLPVQILLNNLLYDVSELPIPMDRVDDEFLSLPRPWDTAFIRNFMLAMGPVSSLFDFLTFFILLRVFNAGEALFQTGWFVESLATQVLVIFVIRTRGRFFRSRPSLTLATTSFSVLVLALWLPFSPFAAALGFVALPLAFFPVLLVLTLCYLTSIEMVKTWFFRRHAQQSSVVVTKALG
jgi:Mg2+-importing ATPase